MTKVPMSHGKAGNSWHGPVPAWWFGAPLIAGADVFLTPRVLPDLSRGREGFDFLGCHLHKRMSGPIWERTHRRVYYLHRWPSPRAMGRVRARIRALTSRSRCHEAVRRVIADINPVVRGWGQYFRTGNAAVKFIQLWTSRSRWTKDGFRKRLMN